MLLLRHSSFTVTYLYNSVPSSKGGVRTYLDIFFLFIRQENLSQKPPPWQIALKFSLAKTKSHNHPYGESMKSSISGKGKQAYHDGFRPKGHKWSDLKVFDIYLAASLKSLAFLGSLSSWLLACFHMYTSLILTFPGHLDYAFWFCLLKYTYHFHEGSMSISRNPPSDMEDSEICYLNSSRYVSFSVPLVHPRKYGIRRKWWALESDGPQSESWLHHILANC